MITLRCPDGSTASGYLAEVDGARAGVVVIQEWWGNNSTLGNPL